MRHRGQPSLIASSLELAARRLLGVAVPVAACGLLAACGSSHSKSTSKSTPTAHPPVTPSGQSIGHLSTPGTPKGEEVVPIQVIATPGQAKRETLALVPVSINGQGPFPFALDTGASRSLIALALAQKLHLPRRGSAGTLFGIGGASRAQNIVIAHWRAGHIALPAEVVAAITSSTSKPSGPAPKSAAPQSAHGPVGLLGSDVLSRYGKIAIDYDKGLLILDPAVK